MVGPLVADHATQAFTGQQVGVGVVDLLEAVLLNHQPVGLSSPESHISIAGMSLRGLQPPLSEPVSVFCHSTKYGGVIGMSG
jgi:hypothetical protein